MRKGPRIRTLLFGAHATLWAVPLAAFALLRIYDVVLLRQTEHQLIAEAVVIGEAYRAAYLKAEGKAADHYLPPQLGPKGQGKFFPIEAQIDFDDRTYPSGPTSFPRATLHPPHALEAGHAVEPLLVRAQAFNLSGVRVLDAQGCVVATTGSEAGACMGELPEVRSALGGHYSALLRERHSDSPTPPLGDIRRRGHVRVFVALPVFSDGKVIAVVRASRTGLDALSALWANRRGLLWLGIAFGLLLMVLSIGFSTAIARPLGRLTRAAQRVAQGASARDLTLSGSAPREIAELGEVLSGMATRLETRATYVREFASQVSHELKTPITAVRGAAELLAQGLDDMPAGDRARFLANIEEDTRRMERLVTRLLALARAENAELDTQLPELDAARFARSMLERYGERVVLYGPAAHPLAIREEQLASVLQNLVDNALRHGAGKPVVVELAPEGARLRIAVSDQGEGVSEANQKRLFERFFTTERDRGGTGLGLAIVKAIAEARGGRVAAQFAPGRTTFTVWL